MRLPAGTTEAVCLWRTAVALLLLVTPGPSPRAQPRPAPPAAVERRTPAVGRIRGVVFDSLLMQPIRRATVLLMNSARSTVADDKGRFSFDSVPAGMQPVAFSTPELDSLGLGTLGTAVVVSAGQTTTVRLTTPSLRTLWSYRCTPANTIGSDSAVVWGTVRDAATDATLGTATAAFSWFDLKQGIVNGLHFRELRKEVATDSTGIYVACGLPVGLSVTTAALAGDAASGRVEYAVEPRGLHRLDLLVSRDMVVPDTTVLRDAKDSTAAERARGSAVMRGTVVDEKGRPLSNAVVAVPAADTSARTDDHGRFQLGGLPAGTQLVQVRRVGIASGTQLVQLRPGRAADVEIHMSGTHALATLNVRGRGAERLEYENRRDKGMGFAIDSTVLNHRADLFSALSNIPLTRVVRNGAGISMVVRNLSYGSCEPDAFLDGMETSMTAVSVLPPDYFRSIEVLPAELVPANYFVKRRCGVVLFWSRNVRW